MDSKQPPTNLGRSFIFFFLGGGGGVNCLVVFSTHFILLPISLLFMCTPALTIKAAVHVKAVLTSLNTAFVPISRSRFKQR